MDFQTLIPIWAVVCPLVFLAGLVDAMAGGGGLISLPSYLLAGLPPHMAVGTNKCGAIGTLLATGRFLRRGQYHASSAVISVIAALTGSWLGARLNLIFPSQYLYYLMLGVIPVLAVFLFLKPDFGTQNRINEFSPRMLLAMCGLVAFLLGCYDGFFGPGTGTFLILALTGLCGFDLLTASGNAKLINSASNVAALATYAVAGQVWWQVGIPAALCNLVGAYIGAGVALKRGAKAIRPVVFVVLALLLAKLLWDLVV